MTKKSVKLILIVLLSMSLFGCARAVRIKNITRMPVIVPKSQETKPVMLKKVVIKLSRGQFIGSVQAGMFCIPQAQLFYRRGRYNVPDEEYTEILNEELEKNGYTVVGDPTSLWDDEEGDCANFLIGALITDIKANVCYPNLGWGDFLTSSGEAYMEIEWQIYSRLTRDVVLRFKTEGSSKTKNMEYGSDEAFYQAFSVATNNMLADRNFFQLVALHQDIGEKVDKKELKPIQVSYKKMNEKNIGDFSDKNMIKKARNAAVTIFAGDGWGSGFLISNDGYILTNAHVVGGANFVQVKLVTGSERTGEVIRKDKRRDVALVKLEADLYPYIVLSDSSLLSISDEVFAIGTPKKEKYSNTVSKGIVSSFRVDEGIRYIQSDVTVHPGNSGGPLISEKSGAVGITVQAYPIIAAGRDRVGIGLNYFIPVEEALDILKIKKAE
ncbi:MAG: S1C family serine protease [Candidatus Omnitrophica bacterium]|nr:S1C family serine protease [Candidatus Omnitrophota bacterium]